MDIKAVVRPLPGARRMSLLLQHLSFDGSAHYWEKRYARKGTSGEGSYGPLAHAKAEFINAFVRKQGIRSVTEFGCGDGNQLSLADYPRYIGLDVSRTAIGLCKLRFVDDPTKSFFLYDGDCFVDRAGLFAADLVLSLDVVYHLVEDSIFANHMTHVFGTSSLYIIFYATDIAVGSVAPHVRHRRFTSWIRDNMPQWQLDHETADATTEEDRASFFVYRRRSSDEAQ